MVRRFPAEPTETEKEAPSATGPIRYRLATFDDAKHSYAATAIAFPATSKFSVKSTLDGWRDRSLAQIRGKLVSEKPMCLDGHEGREVVLDSIRLAKNVEIKR